MPFYAESLFKCERCGFSGFSDHSMGHVCRVFVRLDDLEKDKKDAERYRWLREHRGDWYFHDYNKFSSAELDAAIDEVVQQYMMALK